jgi:hypothetical protein
MADAALAETIVEMMRAQLAECEEMISRGVAPPGTAEHVDMIRTLLATFAARNAGLGENLGGCPWRARPGLRECVTRSGAWRHGGAAGRQEMIN